MSVFDFVEVLSIHISAKCLRSVLKHVVLLEHAHVKETKHAIRYAKTLQERPLPEKNGQKSKTSP